MRRSTLRHRNRLYENDLGGHNFAGKKVKNGKFAGMNLSVQILVDVH